MDNIHFNSDPVDAALIKKIVSRAMHLAEDHGLKYSKMEWTMDITAAHLNGNRLDLDRLLAADDFNFMHDVFGIRRHLDRETGKLLNCFSPRFSAREHKAA